MSSREVRLQSHLTSLSRVIDFTKMADAKAAPILILHTALLGILASKFSPFIQSFNQPVWGIDTWLLLVAICAYILTSILSAALAGRVFMPSTPRTGESLIYFEDVAKMPRGEFEEQSRDLDDKSIEGQLLQQIYQVSTIASTKMYRVRWSLRMAGIAVALWLVLLFWQAIAIVQFPIT